MVFCESVEKERYDSFAAAHMQKSHFMQSAAWGVFNERERGLTPHYVGMEDSGKNLVAAALLLERRLPFFSSYFYSPRGFVIDFFDETLLKAFAKEVGEYCRAKGAMFLRIDPDIELREINSEGSSVCGGFDNSGLLDRLKLLGFRHRGFNKGFESRQPRYTFRIDLLPDKDTVVRRVSGNVMKNVRRCENNYETEICLGDSSDVKTLHRLISQTSERRDFYAYTERYYQNFYDTLSEYGMAKLYIGKIYPKKTAEKLTNLAVQLDERAREYKKERKISEAKAAKERLLKEAAAFERCFEKYGEEVMASAHMVVRYGSHAWAVHAGSSDVMRETQLNNRVYLYKILNQKETGAVWLDQFGTIGNPKENRLASLHEFKRQFGGRYIEFVGEFDMVFRPFMYFLYEKALPLYRSLSFGIKALVRRAAK